MSEPHFSMVLIPLQLRSYNLLSMKLHSGEDHTLRAAVDAGSAEDGQMASLGLALAGAQRVAVPDVSFRRRQTPARLVSYLISLPVITLLS